MTTYLSTAARTARALLTPDSPDLPVGPTWWADRRNRVWIEHNGWLHVLNECTGRTTRAKWPPLLVQVAYAYDFVVWQLGRLIAHLRRAES